MATRQVLRLALAGSLGALALSVTACGGGQADTATFCKDASKVTEHLVEVQNTDGAPASASSWKRLAAETAHLAEEAPDEVSNDLVLEQKWMAGVAANGVINESSATQHAGHDFGNYLAKHCSGVHDESSSGSASSSTSGHSSTQDDPTEDAFDHYVDQVTNEMMNTNEGCQDDRMMSDDTCATTTTTTTANSSDDVNVSTDDSQYSVDGSEGSSYSDTYDGGASNNDDGTDQCQTAYLEDC